MSGHPPAPDRWQETWKLFHALLDRPPEDRAAWLAGECRGDVELRREVEELVAAHEAGNPVLDEPLPLATPSPAGPAPGEERAPLLRSGEVLAERFEIVRRIGAGGMGEVYEAEDRELGRRIALKTLLEGRARTATAQARFRKEIHLAQQVTHRNVCRVYDLVRDGDLVFLTMELLEGETLAERLARGGRLSLAETRSLLDQVVAALGAAHRAGVVHRDLKPSNVILVEEPEGLRAVVTDFGLATSGSLGPADEPHLTRTGEALGTPTYMAPEQLEAREVGPATDVYALGLLLFECLTGLTPFRDPSPFSSARRRLDGPAPSPRELRPELDARWEGVVLRCLKRRPEDRFQRPREVIEALTDPSIPLPTRASGTRRFPWRWAVAAVGISAVAVGGALLGWLDHQPAPAARPAAPAAEETTPEDLPWVSEPAALLIADFANETSDPSLDGVVEPALARALSDLGSLNVISGERRDDHLALLRLLPNSPVDLAVARRLVERDPRIRAVLVGRLVSAEERVEAEIQLVTPQDGSILAAWSEDLEDASDLSTRITRLVPEIRASLEKAPLPVEATGPLGRRVTTPSSEAARLFDQADAAIHQRRSDVAEALLREAIQLDPEFASAYNHLAYTIHNLGRPLEEYLPFAQRAFELAEELPSRERYFILASYYGFKGDEARAMTHYEVLLRLHPDHYWANNNMAHIIGGPEALPFLVNMARHRPDDLNVIFGAALALSHDGRRGEERPYIERVVALAPASPPEAWGAPFAWARLWAAHGHWLHGDLEEARSALDQAVAMEQAGTLTHRFEAWWTREIAVREYRTLGLTSRARELIAPVYPNRDAFEYLAGLDAHFRGDGEIVAQAFTDASFVVFSAQESLERSRRGETYRAPENALFEDPVRVAGLARAGRVEEARRVFEQFRELLEVFSFPAPMVEARMEGLLALAEGRTDDGLAMLHDALTRRDWAFSEGFEEAYGASYYLASQDLASALHRLGRESEALAVLETAVGQRWRAYPCGTELWLATQLQLARLDRELGRPAEAERLEGELRDLTRLAEPDFWLVEALERAGSAQQDG